MKKYLLLIAASIAIVSCSGGGDDPAPNPDPDPDPSGNKVPTTPTLTDPTDNLLCIDNNLVFNWEASTDPDGDAVKYTIEISKNIEFTQITHSFSNLTSTTKTVLLDKAVAYYWRVKANDSKNASSEFSSIFQLYTEGIGEENHLPFSPKLIQPSLGSTTQGNSVSLSWGATDVDNDALVFDVYLDTNNPPVTTAVTSHTEKSYVASSLAANTTYYWKVVAKDDKGGVTLGQIWSFKTE
ncbi:fibronectin type III domain-containing protein [Flavivirga rizhaonensis]|uniref:Fibronectin type-III domain-containing protein n=1 Tax=Flavivirga rizhaonensis TaxID=2559571 RepID=A0A4V3P578_9FLAO|nr:fibronectin type III domain-containing protein [Flavivirga rizhaonensis]TGV04174.1 hypothetical protein EM932_03280 [Flavivirga rizhaonensis]